jgi:hypothetical protein
MYVFFKDQVEKLGCSQNDRVHQFGMALTFLTNFTCKLKIEIRPRNRIGVSGAACAAGVFFTPPPAEEF